MPPWDGAIPKLFKLSSDDEIKKHTSPRKLRSSALEMYKSSLFPVRAVGNPVASKIPAVPLLF